MKNNKEFAGELINKIKGDKLSPKSKWKFKAKECSMWLSGVFAMLLGSISFSVIIYFLRNNDWNVYKETKNGFWEFFLLTIPYFWIILLISFIFLVYKNIEHTKKGYKYTLLKLIVLTITISIFLGSFLYVLGFGRTVDNILSEKAPFYRTLINPKMKLWSKPEEGRLGGIIMEVKKDAIIIVDILDVDKKEWEVYIDKGDFEYELSDKFKKGTAFRFVGNKLSDNTFEAKKILPFGPGKNFFNRHKIDCPYKEKRCHRKIEEK